MPVKMAYVGHMHDSGVRQWRRWRVPHSPRGVRRCCRPLCGEKPWWLRCCQWPRPKAIAPAEGPISTVGVVSEWRPIHGCVCVSKDFPLPYVIEYDHKTKTQQPAETILKPAFA